MNWCWLIKLITSAMVKLRLARKKKWNNGWVRSRCILDHCHATATFSFQSRRVVAGRGDKRGGEVEDRNGRKGMGEVEEKE